MSKTAKNIYWESGTFIISESSANLCRVTQDKTMAKKFVDFKKLRNFRLLRRILLLLIFLSIEEGLRWAGKFGYIHLPSYVKDFFDIALWILGPLIAATLIIRLTEHRFFNFIGSEMEVEQRILFTKIYSNTFYFLALAVIAWKMGVTIENITIFLGLIATGVAFAVRDVINSYFTWFIILTKNPFRLGDYVKIGDEAGVVERIGTFFITLRFPGATDFVKVPNNTILTKPIINMGHKRVLHTIKFPIKTIPPDIAQRLIKLDELAKTVVTDKGGAKANLNTEAGGPVIAIVLPLPVGQLAKRTEFLAKAGDLVNDILAEGRMN